MVLVRRKIGLIFFGLSLLIVLTLLSFTPARINNVRINEADNNLFLIFNQPRYAVGDTIFFSGFYFFNGKLVQGKDIIRTELFNSSGKLISENRFKFTDGVGTGNLLLSDDFIPGNYFLLAHSENMPSLNNRWFVSEILVSDEKLLKQSNDFTQTRPSKSGIVIQAGKENYNNREEVKLKLKLNAPGTSAAFVSVSVYKEDLFVDGRDNFLSIYPTTYYQENGNSNPILKSPVYFEGVVRNKKNESDVKGTYKILFYLNRNDFAYSVTSRQDGHFQFPMFKDFFDENIFYRIYQNGKEQIGYDLDILSEQPPKPILTNREYSDLNDPYYSYANRRKGIVQSYDYYLKKQLTSRQVISQKDFDCDDEIVLSKFEGFPTMGEVFINIVPNVRYLKRKSRERIEILLTTAIFSQDDPLFIVNSMMIDSMDYVMKLLPEDVRRIGVLRSEQKLNRFGELGKNGIILIETIDPEITPPKSHKMIHVTGVTPSIQYHSKSHAGQKDNYRVPDLRSNLFWSPNLKLTEDVETEISFYTSDDTGNYRIEAIGFTETGKILNAQQRILIRNR